MELRALLRLQGEITMATQVFPAYRIFTDATADLNTALQSGLPPIEVIPMEVQVGEAAYTYGPQGNLTPDAFYQMLCEGQFASTSQINPQTYRKAFEKALKSGYDVLYICFSSGLSGTINAARMCIEELQAAYCSFHWHYLSCMLLFTFCRHRILRRKECRTQRSGAIICSC